MIELTGDQRDSVATVLRKWLGGRDVYAFGSRTNGKSLRTSDLDLAVMGDEELPIEVLAGLRDDFEESDLPFRVDIVLWPRLSPALREAVLRAGCLVSEVR